MTDRAILPVPPAGPALVEAVAALLLEAFPQAYAPLSRAREEVEDCLAEGRIARAAMEGDRVVGFVGARPRYGTTGWELHPLVVGSCDRRKGIGSALVAAIEDDARARGGVTMYLGTDDETGRTSLSGCDLYDRTWDRIRRIRNPGGHPFAFYQAVGYAIVGVIPDANGLGKPDILMAKRLLTTDVPQ